MTRDEVESLILSVHVEKFTKNLQRNSDLLIFLLNLKVNIRSHSVLIRKSFKLRNVISKIKGEEIKLMRHLSNNQMNTDLKNKLILFAGQY